MDTRQERPGDSQLSLQGFEPARREVTDELTLFRRRSDRQGLAEQRTTETMSPTPEAEEGEGAVVWPVAIYTLGRFSLLLNGQHADFGRKMPHRPLEFLKTLIALGGREVPVATLATVMWPDADGDTAQRSFDTTLHRLRRVLGDQRFILLRDGKVTLDPDYCWTDVWFFERLLGQVQRIMSTDIKGKDAVALDRLSEKMLSLYQGHFLSLEDVTPWSVSIRERLRSKYIHNLLGLGRYWESNGFWDKAMRCYLKGLEVDDLVEVFYQRLMVCCLETGRCSEGMLFYRRCRQVLSLVLGLKPEAVTESLYRQLEFARHS